MSTYRLTVIEYLAGPDANDPMQWVVYCTVNGCPERVAELIAECVSRTGRPARAL